MGERALEVFHSVINNYLSLFIDLRLPELLIRNTLDILILESEVLIVCLTLPGLCLLLQAPLGNDRLLPGDNLVADDLGVVLVAEGLLGPDKEGIAEGLSDHGLVDVQSESLHLVQLLVVKHEVVQPQVLEKGTLRVVRHSPDFLLSESQLRRTLF